MLITRHVGYTRAIARGHGPCAPVSSTTRSFLNASRYRNTFQILVSNSLLYLYSIQQRRRQSHASMAPRILIFGSGAIGASYGYILSQAIPASNIVAICRSNYAAALTNGFTVHSTSWGNDLNYRPHVVRDASEAVAFGPFNFIVAANKILPYGPSIPSLLKPAVSDHTAIVLIQNGINIGEPWSCAFPSNPILSCAAYLPVTQTKPAVVRHTDVEALHIGTYPSDTPSSHKAAATTFADLIRQGGASCEVHDNIQGERWTKLLANASWNPISALSRSRDAQFLKASPYAANYVRNVMREIASIARAEGFDINEDVISTSISRSLNRELPGVEPSMCADALAGRNMEVDAIVGNALKVAEDRGVEVPLLKGMYALIKGLDEAYRREREEETGDAGR